MTNKNLSRFNVFGTRFSCLDLSSGLDRIKRLDFSGSKYICFPSTAGVSKAYKDAQLRSILNNSFITFADGKFTEFYARLKGEVNLKSVSGLDLLNFLLNTKLSHYFYGLSQQNLDKLKKKIKVNHPKANILGYKAPPWVDLNNIPNNEQIKKDIKAIDFLKPDLIWVAMSNPKQEYLMYHYVGQLERGIMLGVGAVLLYKAGVMRKGPRWVKKIGMRWFIKMFGQPKRYFTNVIPNFAFFIYLVIKHDFLNMKMDK